EKFIFTTATTGACRWRSSAKTAIRRGAGSMMNGATSLMKRTRITCTSHTVCRGSSMMRNQGCTITGTGTMTRYRGGILHKTPLGWRGDGICIITH
ncbi:putative rhsE, partial [Escherichia coli 94.0618]